jgi:ABC-type transport system substrate-binding protein
VGALVHEPLVNLLDGAPVPSLAEGWTTAADGREWTIRLRRDLVFHDGAPLTARDVVRSLRGFLGSRSPVAARLGPALESIDAVGDSVALRLSEASPLAMHVLAAPEAAIVGARGAGAGPFVPTTPVAIRGSARFVAFSRHARGRPFLDGVVVEENAGRPDVWPDVGLPSTVLLLAIDPRRPPFDRVAVRRSLAAVCDGADLVRHFIKGGTPSLLVPPALEPGGPDPSDAPAPALSAAVTLAVSTEVAPAASQRIVALLSSTGLRVTARPVAPDAIWTDGAPLRLASFTPSVAEVVLALDEIAALVPASDGDAARALRDEAARTGDPLARLDFARRAEAAMRASFVAVPIAALPMGFEGRAGLHGVAVDRTGRLRLEDAWLDP